MGEKFDDKRFEAFYLAYQRRKQPTDKEVIDDLTECPDENLNPECDQDEFVIEPFEMKEEWHDVRFNYDGQLVLLKDENEQPDVIRDRVEKVIIDPFSLTDEMKHCKFDPNGNFIPVENEDDNEEDEEEEAGDTEEKPIEFDRNIAIESLRFVISLMNGKDTVSQTFSNYSNEEQEETFNDLTSAVFQLQFMGLENVYSMKRKDLGKEYNKLLAEANSDTSF